MAQATFSCCCAAIHLEGGRAKRGKKVSGGHFFSPWESPRSSERIPQGCGRSSGIAEGDSNASNPTRRGRVGGEGSTEPNLYFRPFPGENANESPTGHQVKTPTPKGVGVFICTSGRRGLEYSNPTRRWRVGGSYKHCRGGASPRPPKNAVFRIFRRKISVFSPCGQVKQADAKLHFSVPLHRACFCILVSNQWMVYNESIPKERKTRKEKTL